MMAPIIFMADIATLKRGGGGGGGLHVNFHKCIKKYLIDLSVPNFNVTDCRNPKMRARTLLISLFSAVSD